jgi:hypothetical protein
MVHFLALSMVQVGGEVEERCREAEVVRLDLVQVKKSSMGSSLDAAHKVFDDMA